MPILSHLLLTALLTLPIAPAKAVAGPPASAGGAGTARRTLVKVLGLESSKPVDCRIVAEQLSSPEHRLERPIVPPAEVTLDLDLAAPWNLAVQCRGYLAPPRIVGGTPETQQPAQNGAFRLRPSAWLSGRLSPEPGSPVDRLYLELSFASGSELGPRSIGHARLPCALTGESFSCLVPAGVFDARLVARGLAPSYFWGARVEAGGTRDVGVLNLKRGASLAGWVEATARSRIDFSSPPTVVTLASHKTEGWQGNPAEGKPSQARDDQARVTPQGFFQLTGLTAGAFVLEAERAGWSPARAPITLVDAEELYLGAPLILRPLASAEVQVSPPTAPAGSAWEARLLALPAGSNTYEAEDQGAVSPDGAWRSQPVVPGDYLIRLLDGTGAIWHEEAIELEAEGGLTVIDLELVAIEGLLRSGGEPLAATVVFGTTNHVPNVRMSSDAKGRFAGYLPHAGRWPVEVLLGEGRQQRAPDVSVPKRIAGQPTRVELDLPATRLAGTVVAAGKPVEDAFVLVMKAETGEDSKLANLQVDHDGQFEISGLAAGAVRVRAYDRTRSSSWVQAELREGDDAPELRLELGDAVQIRGLLLGPNGPVPGGLIAAGALLPDNQSVPLGETRSSADGTFVLSVDARSTAIDAIALVPGCGLEVGRYGISSAPAAAMTIPCGPSRGQIRLATKSPGGALTHGGGTFAASGLLSLAERAGLLSADERGFLLKGMGSGLYRFCVTGRCVDGELAGGGELTFDRVEGAQDDSN
jgi:hypothetical protein